MGWSMPRRKTRRARVVSRGLLRELVFFALVAMAAKAYFHSGGMYRVIVPHSAAYFSALVRSSRGPAQGPDRFALDVTGVRIDPNEYGAGPVVKCGAKLAVAMTAPAILVTVPILRGGADYVVTATLVAPSGRGASGLTLEVGSDWVGTASVRGDGSEESVTWRVPAALFSCQRQCLRLRPNWGAIGFLESGSGRQPAWCYLTGLKVERRNAVTSPSGAGP